MALKPNCPTTKVVGKRVRIDFHYQSCGDITAPENLVFMPLGGMQTKGLTRSQETESTRDDQTIGDYDEVIGTMKTMSVSGSGFMKYTDDAISNLVLLDQLWAEEGEVRLHIRLTEPHATTYFYAILSNYGRDFPTDTPVTYEIELQVTGSAYGVKVIPTLPYVAPSGLVANPSLMTIDVGTSAAITAQVLPIGAPQSVTYESDDPAVVTVSVGGIVTGVLAGTANITVKSSDDATKTDTVVVTAQ
jgi:predicted secreted protein